MVLWLSALIIVPLMCAPPAHAIVVAPVMIFLPFVKILAAIIAGIGAAFGGLTAWKNRAGGLKWWQVVLIGLLLALNIGLIIYLVTAK